MPIEGKRGKKTSSEDIAKVVAAKVANPDASLRDIEKETGVNYRTNSDILKKEAPGLLTASHKTQSLLEINLEIIEKASKKVSKAMDTMDPSDLREAKVMQDIVETAFKQNRLIDEKATEIVKEVSDHSKLSLEELKKAQDALLK